MFLYMHEIVIQGSNGSRFRGSMVSGDQRNKGLSVLNLGISHGPLTPGILESFILKISKILNDL